MKLLPKTFTSSLKRITGEFLLGVWDGMGPAPSRRPPKLRPRLVRRRKSKLEGANRDEVGQKFIWRR